MVGMTHPRLLLAALAVLAVATTACEDPNASPSSAARQTTVAERTVAPTSTPPATRAPRATPKPVVTKAAVVATTKPPTTSPKPAPVRTTTVAPKPVVAVSTCGAPANRWGYNFCGRGGYITNPPDTFCDVFDCIPSFWESTKGYVMQCSDGMYSHSGGRSGSCSYHDGNRRALYG
jgi:hypothetical protein